MRRNVAKHRSTKTRSPLRNPERELRKIEERYHSLFQSMLEGYAYCKMIFDDNGRPLDFVYLDVNSAFGPLTGLEDVVGRRVTQVIPGIKEENPELFETYGRVALTGKPEKFEIDLKSLGLSLAISVSSPAKGEFVAVFENITERKRMDEALRASEDKYKTLVENASDFIFMVDGKNKTILSANRSAAFPLEKEPEEIQGKSILDLFPKEIAAEYAENLNEVMKTGIGETHESKMAARGKEIWISASLNPVKDLDGKVSSVLCVARDVTEHTRIAKALQESEEKYRAMVESSPNLIGIFQDGTLKYVNNTAILKLGWTYEELTLPSFDPIENVVAQRSRSLLKENVGKRLRGEDVAPYEISLIRKDGSEVQVLVRGAKIIYKQKPAIEFIFDDITERKRMEEELSRSSQFLGSVIENAYVWLDVLDNQQNVLLWNKAAETLSGYSREEVVGHGKIWDWLYPDQEYRKQTMETVNAVLQSGRTDVDTETRIKRKDGQTMVISWNERALTDQDGKAIGTIAIGHDITERKKIDEELRQSEERYRSLFDRVLSGVYRSTHEGRFVEVNPAFVKMFGYSSKQEMLDITNIKKELYFSPEERGTHILDADQESVKEYRMRRKDGSEIWVEDHGGYVHDEQGNIIYHEGTLRDITERKRLEEKLKQYSLHLEELVAQRTGELRESEEKYRELFEACPVSLWEEDFSAMKQFLDELRQKGISDLGVYLANHPEAVAKCAALVKVIDMNKATLNLYDAKSVDEIIGGLSGVLPEQSNRAFVGEVVALVQGKKYYEAEFENRTLRGETKHCNVICAVVPGYEQSLARVLVCIVDLTPQKKLEEELVKSQRLAAIGETAAMVGHDLRNPLQGIAGALHLLKQESLTAEERNEMLRVIEKSLNYSDAIIRDLSDYSAEIRLKLAEATPKSIAREAMGAVKIPRNVTVQDLSEDQPTLIVDTDRMKRVFINLIENAIDAMPQGGTLTISSRESVGNVEIALTDTGSGFRENVMANLWKPLQTTKAKGLGLGLAICKRIVDAHGGRISVRTKAGEGTTLTIGLPIKPVGVEVKEK